MADRIRLCSVEATLKQVLVLGAALYAGVGNTNNVILVSGATYHVSGYIHNQGSPANGQPATARTIFGLPLISGVPPVFGSLTVIDDKVTEGPTYNSPTLGRARGFFLVDSQASSNPTISPSLFLGITLLYTRGPYTNSTFNVLGSAPLTNPALQLLPIVGGTKTFDRATGISHATIVNANGANFVVSFNNTIYTP